jgi:hypothetical protein
LHHFLFGPGKETRMLCSLLLVVRVEALRLCLPRSACAHQEWIAQEYGDLNQAQLLWSAFSMEDICYSRVIED